MNAGIAIAAAALGYLLGSIPFGLLLTRAAGLGDIRAIGSGNIGATNVLRTGHKGLAAATLLLDAAKGVAAVLLVHWLLGAPAAPVAAVAAIIGHCFPVWLHFRGGKGVATGFGIILALSWPVGAIAAAVWAAVAAASRISSAGALAACVAAPLLALAFAGIPTVLAIIVAALIVIARHRANIRRLLAGTEPRIGART
ncbi:MAG TPA: glycerol-3-phosphate 1-O-acyltransferase PlsY [Acetobacteraceae bacterium]|nr:glycerol-3-phosphate 1-O-acyltransferase PlsY [Acetobacteraceae bacterium]